MNNNYQKALAYVCNVGITKENINDACNIYADSYEEYMALWELLAELISKED